MSNKLISTYSVRFTGPNPPILNMRVSILTDDRYGFTAKAIYFDGKMMKAPGEKKHSELQSIIFHSSSEAEVMAEMDQELLSKFGAHEFLKDES